jgi:peroxiredoxin
LQSRLNDIRSAGATVVAVSVDSVSHNRELVEGLGLGFPVLSDSDRTAITTWGVVHPHGGVDGGDIARPATFLVEADGTVSWRNLTDNWRVRVRPEMLLKALAAQPTIPEDE